MGCDPTHILIVEDEEAHAELTKRAIRKAGHANRIDILNDGEQALDYLFNRGIYSDREKYPCPALILLDINLPGIDGIEVLKRIKEDPRLKPIPVIMLTTSKREEDIAASYGHYANSYLTKPVGFKEFEEKVMQIDFYWMNLNEPPTTSED
ncbi:response regulator [Desulforhabdus amnigena]|jgi:CheY-like chemotaxis protein|uniref:Response regulator n=1 Tax=Desulforhabdus amnigena TaxID=40218 RepID=A0A9W6FT49_9BACT|nr:response regulator [Desulforhabdus amnigena]NLJ27733.1 response regulator [Deltaproteobacteria bacterium]GLI32975.1 response regulator [Desulforhabdus amnigena]